jgi:hypothetical protein
MSNLALRLCIEFSWVIRNPRLNIKSSSTEVVARHAVVVCDEDCVTVVVGQRKPGEMSPGRGIWVILDADGE